jgi:hypothetical protein
MDIDHRERRNIVAEVILPMPEKSRRGFHLNSSLEYLLERQLSGSQMHFIQAARNRSFIAETRGMRDFILHVYLP